MNETTDQTQIKIKHLVVAMDSLIAAMHQITVTLSA